MGKPITESDTMTALADIEHRSWVLRKSIWDYMKLLSAQSQNTPSARGYTLDQRRLNSEADRELENILLNAKHWYKAITRSAIPKDLRRSIRTAVDRNVQTTVECLRDIREHWEQTRKYFEDSSIEIPSTQSNVIWFQEMYPNASPWSSGMSVGIGYYIAGPEVLNLHNLLIEVDKVEKILPALQI
jgi:hypothetical protein